MQVADSRDPLQLHLKIKPPIGWLWALQKWTRSSWVGRAQGAQRRGHQCRGCKEASSFPLAQACVGDIRRCIWTGPETTRILMQTRLKLSLEGKRKRGAGLPEAAHTQLVTMSWRLRLHAVVTDSGAAGTVGLSYSQFPSIHIKFII